MYIWNALFHHTFTFYVILFLVQTHSTQLFQILKAFEILFFLNATHYWFGGEGDLSSFILPGQLHSRR